MTRHAITHQFGEPEFRRRLSDKILAAYNHAVAVGEDDLAEMLLEALELSERREAPKCANRKNYDPLGQARSWTAFVAARDDYRAACRNDIANVAAVTEALDVMRAAFRRWSLA
jgi:hypothetical protein